MKYSYSFWYVIGPGPFKRLVMLLPEAIDLVAEFLLVEVADATFLRYIDPVLQGKEVYQEYNGGIFELQVHKDVSRVNDVLAEEEERSCVIETEELRRLMLIWVEARKPYDAYNVAMSWLVVPQKSSRVARWKQWIMHMLGREERSTKNEKKSVWHRRKRLLSGSEEG